MKNSDGSGENRRPASTDPQASASRRSQELIGEAEVASGPSEAPSLCSAGSGGLPWGINTIGTVYHPDVSAGLPDGRWVAAVCEPCPPSLRERFRAAWWVFTGRAHAFIWPKAGDLEAVFKRAWVERRPTPRPFTPANRTDWNAL